MTDLSALRLAICTDTYGPQVNGVSRTLMRLVDAVLTRGGSVRVFTADDPDARNDPIIERYPSRAFWAYPQLRIATPGTRRLTSSLAAFKPTLVHVATEFGVGLAARLAAGRLNIPLVTSYHTNFTAYAAHYHLGFLAAPGWRYLRWFHNGAVRCYCPTEAVRQDLIAHGFQRTAVWSRGVDCGRFSPSHRSEPLRRELGAFDERTLIVASIGRLAAEKGVSTALEAMRLAVAARPGRIRCLIGGDGPLEAELRRHAPEGTHFLGRLDGAALSTAFASADVFLFPSVTDTFGNVLLESMASGVPVIGADVGPTREIIGTDGWLVEPRNATAIADQLVHLADHRDELARMTQRVRYRAEHSSWDQIWNRLGADYLAMHQLPLN